MTRTPSSTTQADAWLTKTVSPEEANSSPSFAATRRAEFNGLIEQGVFSIAHEEEAIGHTIFKARFLDEIRHVGTPQAKFKSRFIVQAYNDNAQGLLTYAPTVQRCSQRMILHVAAEDLENLIIFPRDIIQAYTQTTAKLQRIIYVRPPPILGFPPT